MKIETVGAGGLIGSHVITKAGLLLIVDFTKSVNPISEGSYFCGSIEYQFMVVDSNETEIIKFTSETKLECDLLAFC
jgi:hypothetical protein